MYGAPIYNHDREEYYTLLPDPANENKLYRHIAVIKVGNAYSVLQCSTLIHSL